MDTSRRGLCQSLPFIIGSLTSSSFAQTPNNQPIPSLALPFDQMATDKDASHETHHILNGVTHSGTHLEVHETILAPGASPHPPHHHEHEELFLLSKGTIEVTINGKSTSLGPGSAAFIHSNDEHGVRNTGHEPAQYFVIAIG